MTQARSSLFGIVEVQGFAGLMFRRRAVRFRIGLNCDRIEVQGATLLVFDGNTQIASATYRPLADVDNLPSDFNWDRMMKPHNGNGH
jgi:hypothetical protein